VELVHRGKVCGQTFRVSGLKLLERSDGLLHAFLLTTGEPMDAALEKTYRLSRFGFLAGRESAWSGLFSGAALRAGTDPQRRVTQDRTDRSQGGFVLPQLGEFTSPRAKFGIEGEFGRCSGWIKGNKTLYAALGKARLPFGCSGSL